MKEIDFMPNIKLPEKYFEALCQTAKENGVTAEQYAKQILMRFISKNYLPRG
tara:strand:- start:129 stop:284 length:156 start_codon:yes stop_codon:yes gene_type:complete